MIKKESYYTNDGELVSSRTVTFKGRFDDKKGYSMYQHGKSIMMRQKAVWPKDVTEMDIGKLYRLASHLQHGENFLGYKGNRGVKPMTIDGIGKALGIGEIHARRFVKKMRDCGMMAVDNEWNAHYINPIYFNNGKTINDYLYWMFQASMDEHLPKWAIAQYHERKGGS